MQIDGKAMDLNSFDVDTFLVNDLTRSAPHVMPIERSGHVPSRVIDAAATRFWIDAGEVGSVRTRDVISAPSTV